VVPYKAETTAPRVDDDKKLGKAVVVEEIARGLCETTRGDLVKAAVGGLAK
jgi:hypothetical protein